MVYIFHGVCSLSGGFEIQCIEDYDAEMRGMRCSFHPTDGSQKCQGYQKKNNTSQTSGLAYTNINYIYCEMRKSITFIEKSHSLRAISDTIIDGNKLNGNLNTIQFPSEFCLISIRDRLCMLVVCKPAAEHIRHDMFNKCDGFESCG